MKYFIFFLMIMTTNVLTAQQFESYPFYKKNDLGLTYATEQSTFKVWAPSVDKVTLQIYETDLGETLIQKIKMRRSGNGSWTAVVKEDLRGKYYTFQTILNKKTGKEVPDPYAKAVGTNGQRAQVIDLRMTNPAGWRGDKSPPLKKPTDIIIWEVHVRDLSSHSNSGISNKGKFLGFTEKGTTNDAGLATGLDHLKELGVTHIHLLPSYDYGSVDESKLADNQFNWGYDPMNYNVPEGSYSTDPSDALSRISEFKQMVKALHDDGFRVVMDVVYNHTYQTEGMCLEEMVPGYYYRQTKEGNFSNASGCGNETASERPMVNKYIVESVVYWAKEYHIDGFRFDLMGIHDKQLMLNIRHALDKVDSDIFLYGEGWTAGDSPLPFEDRALKATTYELDRIAAFSDDLRDGLKGSVFEHEEKGFVSGNTSKTESVKFGIVAATYHPQIDYEKVNYSDKAWAGEPDQCINYASCHDNHTLLDRLKISNPSASTAELLAMHKLAQTVVLTSQGIPFLHAGTELFRTKDGEENSYKSPDEINQIDWNRKITYFDLFDYYRKLISLRKAHPAFRMPNNKMIQKYLSFLDNMPEGTIGYTIGKNANGDDWGTILVLFNGTKKEALVDMPVGNWKVVLTPEQIDEEGLFTFSGGGDVAIPATGALILVKVE